jgi:NAD(P) transhydrogenase subunit alpha
MKKGAGVTGLMNPTDNIAYAKACAKAGVTAYALEYIPRISRAQSMDVLSSQSNLAGYRAVVEAGGIYGRAFPMMMTAAGTVAPAKVFIMGVGVAGLQAIATARRLGAVTTATDVRPATKEQVASLGAKFIAVENEEFKEAETAGGYAKQMSAEYQKLQAELTASHIAKQDIVVTTALIPGRPAPKLIDKKMIASMRPGSVIVDLAVERGGNCAGAKPGEIVTTKNGVKIVGHLNWPSRMASDASNMFARNLKNFLPIVTAEDGAYAPDWDDEIIQGCVLTKDGLIINERLKDL